MRLVREGVWFEHGRGKRCAADFGVVVWRELLSYLYPIGCGARHGYDRENVHVAALVHGVMRVHA